MAISVQQNRNLRKRDEANMIGRCKQSVCGRANKHKIPPFILHYPKARTRNHKATGPYTTNYNMAGRAPHRHDNYQGWNHIAHIDQQSSSTAAEYNPKGNAKKANFGKQPGTPPNEKRW